MQVSYSLNHLEDYMLYTLFWQRKFAFSDVVEQIFTRQVLQDDEVVLVVLKQIDQLNYILMLTHFKNFYFSSLLVNFDWFHISFRDHLYCNLGPISLVSRKFNHTKLTLAQVIFDFVKVMNI